MHSSKTPGAGARSGQSDSGIRHPAWLIALLSAPQFLLLFFLGRDFEILRSELAAEFISDWYACLASLALLWLAFSAYGIACWARGRGLFGAALAPALLVVYIAYLFLFLYHCDDLYPASTPAWIVSPDNGFIYALTFLTPALLYALVLGVYELTPEDESARRVWWNFAGLVSIPVGVYLSFMILSNVRVAGAERIGDFLFPVVLIAASVSFFFLLIRGVLLLGRGKPGAAMRAPGIQIPFRLVIGVLFPLAGLILNNHGELIGMKEMTHVFGDFDHPAFYVFAVLNGLVLLLPDRDEAKYRAGVFLARLFLFPYSLYFCVVFLPYLPLALFAIVFVGLGFLMLTPLVLTLVHLRVLLADYRYLKSLPAIRLSFRARSLVAAGLLSLALWPLAVSAAYYHERRTLHAALDYVYLPNHANSRAGLDTRALRKTLLEIRRYKASAGTPYLGLYYQWLVLDNLTVSDAKIDRLQRLFFGATEEPPQPDGLWGGRNRNRSAFGGGNLRPPSRYGRLIRASSRTIYDARTGVYRSVVDLTLSYPGTAGEAFDAQTEYQTRFRLPPGARVSEYYLDIAGKREYGMLAEKKSALWIYNQITGFRQDPGLLYYEDALTLALRVFPIPRGGRRTTGFEIVHVEPFALELDGRSLELSAPGPRPELIAFPEGLYISAAAKAKAPSGKRVPYYSFVLDCAGRDGGDPGETPLEPGAEDALYVAGMLAALEKEMLPGAARDVQVSCANYEFSSRRVAEPTAENLAGSLRDLRRDILRRGSFALGRTLRALLIQSSRGDQSGERFPVFFALTTRTDRVANEQVENLSAGLKNLSWITPESPNFYLLDHARSSGAPEPGFALRRYSFHGDVFAEPVAGGRINFSATAWFDLARLATAASPRGAAPSTGGPAIDRAVVVGRNETATVIPTLDRALDPAKTALATQGSAPGEKRRAARRADSGEQSNDRNETRATAAIILAAAAVESNHLLFPAEAAEFYGAMVRASFGAHLLLQSTSFLSVETEAQKLALKRKQDQVLRGHSALDAGEEPVRMDEPGFWVLALLVGAGLLRRYWRRGRNRRRSPAA